TPDVVEHYADTVSGYVLPRWTVSTEPDEHGDAGAVCPNRISAPFEMVVIDDEPHVRITIDSDCRDLVGAEPANYRFTTGLFPGAGGPGTTTTVVVYVTAAGTGVAELDTDRAPTMTTNQDWGSRMWEFFVLGGEHLLFGPDHILFLLAL